MIQSAEVGERAIRLVLEHRASQALTMKGTLIDCSSYSWLHC